METLKLTWKLMRSPRGIKNLILTLIGGTIGFLLPTLSRPHSAGYVLGFLLCTWVGMLVLNMITCFLAALILRKMER